MNIRETMQKFETGATRNDSRDKLDFDGFLSPLVIERFAQYMHKNRSTADGGWRDSDNWQRGIPLANYMKSAWRHFFSWWKAHRCDAPIVHPVECERFEDDLCAILFNVQGYLHEFLRLKAEREKHKEVAT